MTTTAIANNYRSVEITCIERGVEKSQRLTVNGSRISDPATFYYRGSLFHLGGKWDKPLKCWTFADSIEASAAFSKIVDDGFYREPSRHPRRKSTSPPVVDSPNPQPPVVDSEPPVAGPEMPVQRQCLEFLQGKAFSTSTQVAHGLGFTGYDKRKWVRSVLEGLRNKGLVVRRGEQRCRWSLTTKGKEVLKGTSPVVVTDPVDEPPVVDEPVVGVVDDSVIAEIQKLSDKVADLESKVAGSVKTVLEIRRDDKVVTTIEGEHYHPCFDRIVTLCKRRRNIMLVGPTGSGKSHVAHQVACSLFPESVVDGWCQSFGAINYVDGMPPSHLTGRMILNEEGGMVYVPSQFVKVFKEGGIFLGDEQDNADPNTLLVINTALANGYIVIAETGETIRKHEDFVYIGSMNTYGRGADRLYVGRNQLDEATLDRFRSGMVEFGYDTALERSLCPDEGLLNRLWDIREKVVNHRLERVVSTRFIKEAYEDTQRGDSVANVLTSLTFGWSKDELAYVGLA